MNPMILGGLVVLLAICIIIFIRVSRPEPKPPYDPKAPNSKLRGSTRLKRHGRIFRKPATGKPIRYHDIDIGRFTRPDHPQPRDEP